MTVTVVALAGCAPPAERAAIREVEPFVRAEDPSAHKVVEGFDDGEDPNDIGGEAAVEAAAPHELRVRYLRRGEQAFGLKLTATLRGRGEVAWTTSLNELDVSQAKAFSFWIKGAAGGERVRLRFRDHDGGHGEIATARLLRVSTRWQRCIVPLALLPGVNFGHLDRFSIVFDGRSGGTTLMIDQLAFHGESELFFKSLADNLRAMPSAAHLDPAPLLQLSDEELLRRVAQDTWGYFRDLVDMQSHLVVDFLDLGPARQVGDFTSMTNLGLYLFAVVSAHDLGWLTRAEAVERIRQMLDQMEALPRWHGLWYNYYMTTNLQIGRHYISSIDNGWFAAGLVVARQAFAEELGTRCARLLEEMQFAKLYLDKYGQFNLGFDFQEGYSPYHYGLLMTEARLLSWIGIGKGEVPRSQWWRMHRTLPQGAPQAQTPKGQERTYDGHRVFQGYYVVGGQPIVPGWGGSLFEYLMPWLVIDEMALSPQSFGENAQRAVQAHIARAQRQGYPVWGISPCGTPDLSYGGYHEFGAPELGSRAAGGYPDEGVVTPHASILALSVTPEAVIANLRNFLRAFPQIYGPYGFYDSVQVKTRQVSTRFLALDQGMILASLNNYLNHGILRKRFHADPIGQALIRELGEERFFEEE